MTGVLSWIVVVLIRKPKSCLVDAHFVVMTLYFIFRLQCSTYYSVLCEHCGIAVGRLYLKANESLQCLKGGFTFDAKAINRWRPPFACVQAALLVYGNLALANSSGLAKLAFQHASEASCTTSLNECFCSGAAVTLCWLMQSPAGPVRDPGQVCRGGILTWPECERRHPTHNL